MENTVLRHIKNQSFNAVRKIFGDCCNFFYEPHTACGMQSFVLKHLEHIRHRALNGWLNVGKVIAITFSVVCGWNIMTPFSIYSVYYSLPTA